MMQNQHPITTDGGAQLREDASLPIITSRYLLVINIPLYRVRGKIFAGHLWFKDLASHLDYLGRLTIACPVVDASPSENAVPLSSDARFSSIEIIELPVANGMLHALLAMPRTLIRLFSAIRGAEIVHTGVVGWPIPYGWLVTPIATLLRKKILIIVESAPWRLNQTSSRSLKSVLMALIYETFARWCVGSADLAIFTQENYRRTLLRNARKTGHIIHASWIDASIIISDADAHDIWQKKLNSTSCELAILFAGRLDRQKGLVVLLDAIRLAARKNLSVKLDILGTGELADLCMEVSKDLTALTRVSLLGTVAYGDPLFRLLRGYHALVLPSISDEQPRIVYDAYSQGVPVLASRTTGLQACIDENRSGWFVEPNSVEELAQIIERAAGNLGELQNMGMQALRMARAMTHQRMHRERHQLLLDLVNLS